MNDQDQLDALVRVHAELMGKATEHRIIADHIKAAYPSGTAQYGAWHYHHTASNAYATAAGRVFATQQPAEAEDADKQMTAEIHGRTIPLLWPDGSPVMEGQIPPETPVRYNLRTGVVEGIEKP